MTSPTKHTPGPWKVRDEMTFSNEVVAKDSGNCDVLRAVAYGHDVDEISANARLIASAPEMYDELFRVLAVIRSPQAFEVDTVCSQIERVLAKAEGR